MAVDPTSADDGCSVLFEYYYSHDPVLAPGPAVGTSAKSRQGPARGLQLLVRPGTAELDAKSRHSPFGPDSAKDCFVERLTDNDITGPDSVAWQLAWRALAEFSLQIRSKPLRARPSCARENSSTMLKSMCWLRGEQKEKSKTLGIPNSLIRPTGETGLFCTAVCCSTRPLGLALFSPRPSTCAYLCPWTRRPRYRST